MITFGIDIGLTGAIAVIEGQRKLLWAHVAPTCDSAKNGRRMYDESEMWRLVGELVRRSMQREHGRKRLTYINAWVEESGGYGPDGKFSHHSRGWGYGAWRMALVGNGLGHFSTVRAQQWRKLLLPAPTVAAHSVANLKTKKKKKVSTKIASIAAAERLFGATDLLHGPNGRCHDGICEAALIAAYGAHRAKQKGGDA